jgi:tetratricopeptide (TPR) repeat protein
MHKQSATSLMKRLFSRMSAVGMLVGLVITASSLAAQSSYPPAETEQFLLEAQRLLFNDRFKTARSLCRSFITKNPDDPVGYLFEAAAYLGEMTDREEDLYGAKVSALLDTALMKCDTADREAAGAPVAWNRLWRGLAYSYRSIWKSKFGSLASAIKLGFKARNEYRAGLAADSGIYELYFGLGNYHYWKSVKAGILRTIGVFRNDIDKGIAELYLAADSSRLFAEAARNSLVWVWLDRKEYDSAIAIATEMTSIHPDGKTLLWPLARAYYRKGDYDNALATYGELRRRIAVDPGNYYNLIECDYQIYRCQESLRRQSEATQTAVGFSNYSGKVPSRIRRIQRVKVGCLLRAARR